MQNHQAIILLSGGLDSAVSMALAIKKDYQASQALTFDYGQKAAKQEIKSARRLCRRFKIPHRIIDIKWLGKLTSNPLTDKSKPVPHKFDAKSVWIPNRNGLFINIAASYAEARGYDCIITGFNKEEAQSFPDNSIAFVNAINNTLRYSTLNKVKVISFTAMMNKTQIIRQAETLGLEISQLWSCYEGGKKPCGKCESCLRRLVK